MIALLDYGAGNLRSVTKALELLGATPCVSEDPADIAEAEALVLPGQGACDSAMRALDARGLTQPVREAVAGGRLAGSEDLEGQPKHADGDPRRCTPRVTRRIVIESLVCLYTFWTELKMHFLIGQMAPKHVPWSFPASVCATEARQGGAPPGPPSAASPPWRCRRRDCV